MVRSVENFLFTSESVTEGHPDKLCDQISDAVLDECLRYDPNSRVACEASTKTGFIILFGELKTKAKLDFQKVVRNVVKDVGFDDSDKSFDYKTCGVLVSLEEQSDEISHAVDHEILNGSDGSLNGYPNLHLDENLGAGDQGLMFGYATDETREFMPLTAVLAHSLTKRLTECRKSGMIPWLYPDGKSQVTVEYKRDCSLNGESPEPGEGALVPLRIHTIVISTQTKGGIPIEFVRQTIERDVIKAVIPPEYLDDKTILHIQPSGSFVVGGPKGDSGLTGRKIIVDTYGGWGAHGGGCFSGKDYTKVDRSAAYAARWIAISLVNSGICRRCLIQVSYAIGISHPLSININTYGTSRMCSSAILKIINNNFDLRPFAIVRDLDLAKPIYRGTASYGHFKPGYPWEIPKNLVF